MIIKTVIIAVVLLYVFFSFYLGVRHTCQMVLLNNQVSLMPDTILTVNTLPMIITILLILFINKPTESAKWSERQLEAAE